jgi:hypothetical protein
VTEYHYPKIIEEVEEASTYQDDLVVVACFPWVALDERLVDQVVDIAKDLQVQEERPCCILRLPAVPVQEDEIRLAVDRLPLGVQEVEPYFQLLVVAEPYFPLLVVVEPYQTLHLRKAASAGHQLEAVAFQVVQVVPHWMPLALVEPFQGLDHQVAVVDHHDLEEVVLLAFHHHEEAVGVPAVQVQVHPEAPSVVIQVLRQLTDSGFERNA